MFGIIDYGVYVPEQLAADEDSFTLAVESVLALGQRPENIDALYVGSESHPYAVKSTSAMVADWFGWEGELFAADVEFACKAGTSAMQIVWAFLKSGLITNGLVVGTDVATANTGDKLAENIGAGAAAFVLGSNKENDLVAEIVDTVSYCTDMPDFWRKVGDANPVHAGRFTGEPAYFAHCENSWKLLSDKNGLTVEDVDYFVFHQPNSSFPRKLAQRLNINWVKVEAGYVFDTTKNCYTATVLIGLAKVLDIAKSGEKIVVISYGSGAGSDALYLIKQ